MIPIAVPDDETWSHLIDWKLLIFGVLVSDIFNIRFLKLQILVTAKCFAPLLRNNR